VFFLGGWGGGFFWGGGLGGGGGGGGGVGSWASEKRKTEILGMIEDVVGKFS
jgi:hypothetical protein